MTMNVVFPLLVLHVAIRNVVPIMVYVNHIQLIVKENICFNIISKFIEIKRQTVCCINYMWIV